VHLKASVVRRVGVVPGPLEAVDTEPLTLVGRVLCSAPDVVRDLPPGGDLRSYLRGRLRQLPGERLPNGALPAPDFMAILVDLPLDLALLELGRAGIAFCGRRRFRRALCAQCRGSAERDHKDAGARECECEFLVHLSDPPGSTPPRDCAAA